MGAIDFMMREFRIRDLRTGEPRLFRPKISKVTTLVVGCIREGSNPLTPGVVPESWLRGGPNF